MFCQHQQGQLPQIFSPCWICVFEQRYPQATVIKMSTIRATRALVRNLEVTTLKTRSCIAVSSRCSRRAFQSSKPLNRASRTFATFSPLKQNASEHPPNDSGIAPPKTYSYTEIQDLSSDPHPNRILIDVREPSELLQTGRIPTAKSVPISSAPDAFFMPAEDFETKFGFPRPSEQDEVIFYCKAGVRSRQASLLAGQARPTFGGKIGNYLGSWVDWEKNGGKSEKEGEQGEQSSASGVTNPGSSVPGTPRP